MHNHLPLTHSAHDPTVEVPAPSCESPSAGDRIPAGGGRGGLERTRPLSRLDRWLGRQLQATLRPGGVRLELWDGTCPGFRGPAAGDLIVQDRLTLIRLIVNPELHFGEAYTVGRVALRGELEVIVECLSRLSAPSKPSLVNRLARWSAPLNGHGAARRNIHHHYDLGNAFYQRWLDPELVYTCAYYGAPDMSLEAAQAAKLDLVCRKLRLQPGESVIEAGCGWGALALYMARRYGVTVRAFNISREQLAFARQRAQQEGLSSKVEFIEDDYRNVTGTCDAFVSVGMLEHVGPHQFQALSHVIRRALRRDTGRGLLHFIGRDRPRPLNAWTRRRIFPGAYPPTLAEVCAHVLEPADLSVLDVENIRLHYARTLDAWRDRFQAAEPEIRSEFGDVFCRAWRLYLAGSAAAFRVGWLQLFQILFAPSAGRIVHWSRDQLYEHHGTS